MAPFHYFCRDLIAASRKGLGCGPAAPTTTAFPALCCLPAACLCCLHTRAMVCRVLPAPRVPPSREFGNGLAGSDAGCTGQPEVGFVQGELGLMLSRHVLPAARKPPALCKITFLFFPPCYHAVSEDAVYSTFFCSLGGSDGEVT